MADLCQQCNDFYLEQVDIDDSLDENDTQIYFLSRIHLFSTDCVRFMLDRLDFYEGKPVFLLYIFKTMVVFSKRHFFSEQLLDYNAINILLDKMKMYRSDHRIQIAAIESLTNLVAVQDDEGEFLTFII